MRGAAIVCREIAKRFSVTRIGADSVGWYADSDWESEGEQSCRETYGEFTSWADWVKAYTVEWSSAYKMFMRHGESWSEDVEAFRELEAAVTSEFERLDAEAA